MLGKATCIRLSLVSRIFLIRRNFIYSGAKPCPRHSPACQRVLPPLRRRANYRGRKTLSLFLSLLFLFFSVSQTTRKRALA